MQETSPRTSVLQADGQKDTMLNNSTNCLHYHFVGDLSVWDTRRNMLLCISGIGVLCCVRQDNVVVRVF